MGQKSKSSKMNSHWDKLKLVDGSVYYRYDIK